MSRKRVRSRGWLKRIAIWLVQAVVIFVAVTVLWVFAYRFIDPPITYLMIRDRVQGHTPKHEWKDLDDISVHMPRAVITAEDGRFCSHNGFDLEAIEQALVKNLKSDRLRGGSTISQQVAKNVFLWPKRSWVRKGLEAYFTVLIELMWDKRRIMEVYLNVVELGIRVFGVEAGAQHYFKKGASDLTRREAARLAAILPQPIKRSASNPGSYTRRYARRIERHIRGVKSEGLDACLGLKG